MKNKKIIKCRFTAIWRVAYKILFIIDKNTAMKEVEKLNLKLSKHEIRIIGDSFYTKHAVLFYHTEGKQDFFLYNHIELAKIWCREGIIIII